MVLYPEEGISQIQKLQMTSAPGPNVCVLGKLVSVFLWHSKEKKNHSVLHCRSQFEPLARKQTVYLVSKILTKTRET